MPILILMFAYTILPFYIIADHFFSLPIAIAIGVVFGVISIFLIGKKPMLVGAVQLLAACVGVYFVIKDHGLLFRIVYIVVCLPMIITNIKGFFGKNSN